MSSYVVVGHALLVLLVWAVQSVCHIYLAEVIRTYDNVMYDL